jgi:uncharacterized protein YndB with AHSA1/START domain
VAVTERKVAATATVHAPAERIFELLTDPAKHPLIDGTGTVQAARDGEHGARLELGSTFGMDMKWAVPYKVTNKVVEYEPGRLIAWRHFGGHRWRWELDPVDADTTEVTETFDWSTAPAGVFYPMLGFPERNRKGMEATLRRLESVLSEE